MSACFLDTSAVVDLMRNRFPDVMAIEPFDELLIGYVVLGELVAGAYKARIPEDELARLERWLPCARIVGADADTAYTYGELLADLEERGVRIPLNDVWVAALAVQFELPLIARDEHFQRLPRLRLTTY